MKAYVRTLVVACALAAPALSFAQTDGAVNGPLTRAQVRADLVRLEQAGYEPGMDDPYYPDNLQAAEARLAQQRGAAEGGVPLTGSSQSGAAAPGQ